MWKQWLHISWMLDVFTMGSIILNLDVSARWVWEIENENHVKILRSFHYLSTFFYSFERLDFVPLNFWECGSHQLTMALCINKINDLIHPGFFTKDSLAVWCQIVCHEWMAKDIQQTLPCNSEVTNQLIWNFWNSHCKLSPELQITACFTYLVEVL